MTDTAVPVVVIFRGGYGAVSIARTLGRLGVPMYLVAQQDVSTPVWFSRYWWQRSRWDFARPEAESLEFLLHLGETIRTAHGTRPLLLTLADRIAIFIERHRAELANGFVFPQAEGPIVRSLLNKWEMHKLAQAHRIPSPATTFPRSLADVDECLDKVGLPLVMKAADPYPTDLPPTKVVHSRQQVLVELGRREARGVPLGAVLQEYIPGAVDSVWMCNGYFGSGEPVIFTGQKLRQVSAAGVASLAVCAPNDTVAAQTRLLMESVGYRGCVGVGWRYDRRDGSYKLLDVNARVSGVFRLFAGTGGIDVVRACYLDMTGQDVPAATLKPGRKWMLEDDLGSAVSAIRDGRLNLRGWARSVRGVQELHWLARDDPLPALVWLRDRLRRAGGRLTKAV